MNVSVTTVLELEEHNEDNFMWCLYFVFMISICFVKTIIIFKFPIWYLILLAFAATSSSNPKIYCFLLTKHHFVSL